MRRKAHGPKLYFPVSFHSAEKTVEGISIVLLKRNEIAATLYYGQGNDEQLVWNFGPTDIKEAENFGT